MLSDFDIYFALGLPFIGHIDDTLWFPKERSCSFELW